MKKKRTDWVGYSGWSKILQIMRLTVFFVLLALMQTFAVGSYSQQTRITLKMDNARVIDVLDKIEDKSEYYFLFNKNLIDVERQVSIDVDNQKVENILRDIFNGTNVVSKVADRQIVLTTAEMQSASEQKQRSVSGKVTDSSGGLLPGVSVVIKGTTTGTITDNNGYYTLPKIPDNAKLQFSFVGMKTQEIIVGTKTTINVSLIEDAIGLEEVVAVGYGTQKKANLTGSVETVKSENIKSKPVTSVMQALTGEAAGVTIIQRSSTPGGNDEFIRIRGVGTFGNANPLILVDGVAMGLDKVNPDDVESVSVLKDAASAAIYGSRAGNGVILVTTKKGGHKGKPQIDLSSNWGMQVVTRLPNNYGAVDWMKKYDKGLTDSNKSPRYTDIINKIENNQLDPDHKIANSNFFDELVHPALQHDQNVSISGSTDNTSYLISLGYLNQGTVVGTNTDFQKYNARINTHSDITKWLKLDANMAYFDSYRTEPGESTLSGGGLGSVMKGAMQFEPFLPSRFSDGTWVSSGFTDNPVRLGTTDDYGYIRNKLMNFNGLVSPEVSFKGFTLKGLVAFEKQVSKEDNFMKTVTYDSFTPAQETTPVQSEATIIPLSKKRDKWEQTQNVTSNIILTYEKSFGKHYVKTLLGASRETNNYDITESSLSGLPNNDLDAIGVGTQQPSIGGGYSETMLTSYFGRINYSFNDRYLLEANIRRDGSSKFARGHRWGVFPSYSLGWKISEESFYMPIKRYVESLKIRASYGSLGNNRINNYQFLSTIGLNTSTGYVLGGNTISNIYNEAVMGNQDITWENLKSYNVGIDLYTLKNRLSLTADYFKRTTTDILLSLEAPGSLGITPPVTNAAAVENKGYEITVNWRDQINEFKYNLMFNLTDVQNQITDLKGYKAPTNNLTILHEGEPINAIYGWEAIGICRTQEDYLKYKDQMKSVSSTFGLGDLIFKDTNDDKVVNANDKKVIGNQIPRYTFGFRLGGEYKNLDFSCFLQGVAKVEGYLQYEAQDLLFNAGNTYEKTTNINAEYPRMYGSTNFKSFSSFWIQDASYIRLKNLQVGYTFKNLRKYNISNLRVSLSGENIHTFTKYKGFDPESPIGMRGWMYPLVGVYSLGVNLTF